MLASQEGRRLAQGVLGDPVERGRAARGGLDDGALPVADLVHGSHDREMLQAAGQEVLDEVEVRGQVVQMRGGIVLEPVSPRHVEDDVRPPEPVVDLRVRREQVSRHAFGAGVDPVQAEVEGLDVHAPLEQRENHVTPDVTASTGDENSPIHSLRY